MWVNAEAVPRFYPNAVTLAVGETAFEEQRATIEILRKSNLPGRWSVKDSFGTLDLSRRGFELLFEAHWIRNATTLSGPATDIVWERETDGSAELPWSDPGFAMFTGRRGPDVVAGFMLYRAEEVAGVSNVVCETADAVAVWSSLSQLSALTFPNVPLVGYEPAPELEAAEAAGFERGDRLRVWVTDRE
jgi:hypothetical protein